MEDNKYPIGKFEYGKSYTSDDNKKHILSIENFPSELKTAVSQFTPSLLEKSYRDGGWSARQIMHHIADSHLNAYIRVKLTLTEDKPVIKPYNQDLWSNLADVKSTPVEVSLALIEKIHLRWVNLLKTLTEKDLERTYIHPEYNREFKLSELLALYAWHGKHHYGHLQIILKNK